MIKNQTVAGFTFLLLDKSSGAPITSGSVSGYVSIDGGEQAALTGAISHLGNGQWVVDEITAEEMNGDVIGLLFLHGDAVPVHFTIDTETPLGPGAIAKIYTLMEDDEITPIADATVWVTTDLTGNNIIARGKTDQYGKVTFWLDAGTVYIWRSKTGFTFANPDTEVVS